MEKYVKSHDGSRIFYVKTDGDKDKPTLVFMHSLGSNWTLWKIEMQFFQRWGYPCLAMDLRGHGLSEVLKEEKKYSINNFPKDVHFVLKKEKIKKFVLIGHSFGGSMALVYCKLFPKHLPRILVVSEACYTYPFKKGHELNVNPFIIAFLRFVANHQKLVNLHLPQLREFDFSTDFHRKQHSRIMLILQALHVTPLKSLFKIMETLEHYVFKNKHDLESFFSQLHIPVLIFSGTHDKVVPKKYQAELHRLIKGSKLKVIKGGYHRVPIERPEDLCAAMKEFIEEHSQVNKSKAGKKKKKKKKKKSVKKKRTVSKKTITKK